MEAQNEIAHTEVARPTALALVVSFLSLLTLVPLVQQLSDDPDAVTRRPRLALDSLPTPSQLRAFEDDLEDASFLRRALLAPTQRLLCQLGCGNEQAYLGRDGWLFYRPDVEHVTGAPFLEPSTLARRRREGGDGAPPPQPDAVRALVDLGVQLRARGIELLVVPTPAKTTLYPEQLSARYTERGASPQNPSYRELVARLEHADIGVVDLEGELRRAKSEGTRVFLATDTHWTPAGVRAAAGAIAERARPMLPALAAPAVRYERQRSQATNAGDIARMLQLDGAQGLFPDEEVDIEVVDIEPLRDAPSAQGPRAGANGEAEVLLLGDSFANIYSLEGMGWGRGAGLAEQLSAELQRPIDKIVINDNGAFATRRQLARELEEGRDRLRGKKLVIYQFAARELSFGDWREFDLEVGEAGVPATPAATDHAPVHVRGTIAAVATMPRPGSVPYKELITSWHLVDVESDGAALPREIVVFEWGMRAGHWTTAAAREPGASVALEVVPWASVAQAYGGYNRAELRDERLWGLDLYWAPLAGADTPAATSPFEASLQAPAEGAVVRGADGWLFFRPELRHLAAGRFWGDAAREASEAATEEWRDPLPAIVDFHQQLDRADIELWFVPVPPKAALYPEALGVEVLDGERADGPFAEFVEALRASGVRVLDLLPHFLEHKANNPEPLYCRQDTHWSPAACVLVAELVASELRGRPWLEAIARKGYVQERAAIEIEGDLWKQLEPPRPEREVLPLHSVYEEALGGRPVAPWRASPVLLLGDSHTLVFQAGGDLLATHSGLADHLAVGLGFPVDLVGVRGSGSTASRLTLFRRRDELAGKKVVLWVVAARELTQSADGWREVPVIRAR